MVFFSPLRATGNTDSAAPSTYPTVIAPVLHQGDETANHTYCTKNSSCPSASLFLHLTGSPKYGSRNVCEGIPCGAFGRWNVPARPWPWPSLPTTCQMTSLPAHTSRHSRYGMLTKPLNNAGFRVAATGHICKSRWSEASGVKRLIADTGVFLLTWF